MVLGLRSKNRKGTSVQIDYLIQVQEIKPWPLSQSLVSAQSLLLQWENGDNSGYFTSHFGDGKVEFTESFRLATNLYKEKSRKSNARDSFQKNYLEFNLYEPRKDSAMKGQLLGSAVIDLADCGIIDDAIAISTPIHMKKSSKSMAQPVLYVNILPFDQDQYVLSKETSLDKDGSETVSEVTNEGNDEENEIASFTDDDVNDNVSSNSSQIITPSLVESNKGAQNHHDKKGPGPGNNDLNSVTAEPAPPASMARTNPKNLVEDLADKAESSESYIKMIDNSNHSSIKVSQVKRKDSGESWRHDNEGPEEGASTGNLYSSLVEEKEEKEAHDNRQDMESLSVKNHHIEKKLVSKLPIPQDGRGKQTHLRSNTLASSRTAMGVPGSSRKDKLKHLKSVQLQFNSSDSDKPLSSNQFVNEDNYDKVVKKRVPSERVASSNNISDNVVTVSSKLKILEEKSSKAAAATKIGPTSFASEHGSTTNDVLLMEKANEIESPDSFHKDGVRNASSGREETKISFSGEKVEFQSKVEMLEEELTEAAAVEVGLYSVVAEHGSSANKVLAPARRLSRFYLHSSKSGSPAKSASAGRAIISGLVLVSKACGNDVPRFVVLFATPETESLELILVEV